MSVLIKLNAAVQRQSTVRISRCISKVFAKFQKILRSNSERGATTTVVRLGLPRFYPNLENVICFEINFSGWIYNVRPRESLGGVYRF